MLPQRSCRGMADLSDLSMTLCRRVVGRRVMSAWILLGGLLGVFPLWLLLNGQRFDWERKLSQIPGGELAVAMVGAGLVYLLLVPLIRYTLTLSGAEIRRAFFLVVAVGAAFRAVMMARKAAPTATTRKNTRRISAPLNVSVCRIRGTSSR